MSYEADLAEVTRELFNIKQLVDEFQAKHGVIIQSLDLTPGTVITSPPTTGDFDEKGYHKVYGITRPDAAGFVRFKALDEAIERQDVKGFPNWVSSVEALNVLGLGSEVNEMTRAVNANAAYVQFLGGLLGKLEKDRASVFFASYTTTDPVTKRTRLAYQRTDGVGFAATQIQADGSIIWQGPTLKEQEAALLQTLNKYQKGATLNEIIFGWPQHVKSSIGF